MTAKEITPESRLKSLNIELPVAPPPAAIYLPYQQVGNQLWIAGQIALRDGKLVYEGCVGRDVSLKEAQECAQLCALNILAQAKSALGELSKIKKIVKLNVFVSSSHEFTQQHLIANGASTFMGDVFGEGGRHARSAVGVSALPLNSPVEIDAVFEVI